MAKKGQKVQVEENVIEGNPGEGIALGGFEYPPDAAPIAPVRPVVNVVTLAAAVRCSKGELKPGAKVPESDFTPAELASLRAQHAVE